ASQISSRAVAGSQPFKRTCATRLMAANTAGIIQAADTIIHGLSRLEAGTRVTVSPDDEGAQYHYFCCAVQRPFASTKHPLTY
ncbi:MAG TPA: hypothetical protein VF251_16285, partial [Pyrinomonadaceae bacterium]